MILFYLKMNQLQFNGLESHSIQVMLFYRIIMYIFWLFNKRSTFPVTTDNNRNNYFPKRFFPDNGVHIASKQTALEILMEFGIFEKRRIIICPRINAPETLPEKPKHITEVLNLISALVRGAGRHPPLRDMFSQKGYAPHPLFTSALKTRGRGERWAGVFKHCEFWTLFVCQWRAALRPQPSTLQPPDTISSANTFPVWTRYGGGCGRNEVRFGDAIFIMYHVYTNLDVGKFSICFWSFVDYFSNFFWFPCSFDAAWWWNRIFVRFDEFFFRFVIFFV